MEYLTQTNRKTIELKDLPAYFQETSLAGLELNETEKNRFDNFAGALASKLDRYLFLLHELEASAQNHIRIGRRNLARAAARQNMRLTEAEIRGMLVVLADYQLTESFKGRSGTHITPLGRRAIRYLEEKIPAAPTPSTI